MTTYHPGRSYRPIMPADIQSAQRGLRMRERSTDWLRKKVQEHLFIDAFASAVIVEAANEIIDERKKG
jgi:hypothetical protein